MKTARTLLAAVPVALALVVAGVQSAAAQVVIDPTSTPVINKSATGPLGPLPTIAALMFALGVGILIFLVISYMRFAPRFSRDENVKVVRADRVHLGRELPRRAVDISQAVAVVVAPPAVPVADGAVAIAPAPAAAAPAPAAPAPAAAAPAPASAPAPAAEAAPASAAPAAPAPAAEERPEVSLDEEVFQQTLDELLAKGTDRRVAEGQARRAAMIAARKKAAGG
jgi:2-oxoglutarate dehydrogenase E2 component (dihydrolipoamide succinyltransferase)